MTKSWNIGGRPVAAPKKSYKQIAEEIDEKLAAIDSVLAKAQAAERDLTAQEAATIDTLNEELASLSAERDDASKRRGLAEALANGSVKMPENMREHGATADGAAMRSASGKPLIMAAGPKQRFNKNPPSGHLIGELARAKAVGVSGFTPDAVRAALRTDDNAAGGFAVPHEWLSGWVDRGMEATSILQYATRIIMDSQVTNVTTIEERPTVQTKAELARFAESGIVFGGRRLDAFLAGSSFLASLEMLADAPNAAAQIEQVCLRGLISWFNRTMLVGTGSEEPLGVLNREDLPEEDSVGLLTWDVVSAANTELRRAIFQPNAMIVSPRQFAALHLQRENEGGDGGFLPRPEHLANLNIVESSDCPDDVAIVADFEQLIVGIREGAKVEVSPHSDESFDRNAVRIRLKLRCDWCPVHRDAFFVLRGLTLPAAD